MLVPSFILAEGVGGLANYWHLDRSCHGPSLVMYNEEFKIYFSLMIYILHSASIEYNNSNFNFWHNLSSSPLYKNYVIIDVCRSTPYRRARTPNEYAISYIKRLCALSPSFYTAKWAICPLVIAISVLLSVCCSKPNHVYGKLFCCVHIRIYYWDLKTRHWHVAVG